jgi:hypothetical protein
MTWILAGRSSDGTLTQTARERTHIDVMTHIAILHDDPIPWQCLPPGVFPRARGQIMKPVKYTLSPLPCLARCNRSSTLANPFLLNHLQQIVAADFFVVPTATGRLLFALVVLAHHRRRVVHVAVTAHPTAAWTAQLLRERPAPNESRPPRARSR